MPTMYPVIATEKTSGIDRSSATGPSAAARVPKVALEYVLVLLASVDVNGAPQTIAQIAESVGQSGNSGAFRTRLSAATYFGFVESTRRGHVVLTELGQHALDSERRREALLSAWMNVPVFRTLYDRYAGRPLPSRLGIEDDLQSLGVTAAAAAQVRRVMISSADSAGLLPADRDRLVMPSPAPAPQVAAAAAPAAASPAPVSVPVSSAVTEPTDLVVFDFGAAGAGELRLRLSWLALDREESDYLRACIDGLKAVGARQTGASDDRVELPSIFP